ncbi:ArsR family transcriptional regulator [Halolamina sp.]|uniref:ArsR family transcriptional regulator n=1 Tax=Halolamina sp. TaxID=1940283 RepID=UPI0035671ABB
MRPLVSWMTKSDDAILELLDECGIAIPPRAIAFNIDNVSRPTIDRRLPKLEDAGLVERYDDPQGYTRITDRGRAYLAGELDADELEEISE